VKALVTGATGFVGRALLERLAAEPGAVVRALARDPARLDGLAPAVEVVRGDVTDPAAVDRAVEGVDAVFHVAGTFREPDAADDWYRKVNAEAVRLVIHAARRGGVRRVVHTSTVGIHGSMDDGPATEDSPVRPDGIYEETKAEGDALALAEAAAGEPEVVVLRPAPVYGPGDTRLVKLFKLAKAPRPILLGDGRALYQMVHVRDLAEAFLLAARRPEAAGQAFLIAGDERPSVNELVAAVARAQGLPEPRPLHLPAAPVRHLAHACEVLCRPIGVSPPLYRRRVDFFLLNRQYDTAKARRLLGFRPAVRLEDGLGETIAWCRVQCLLGCRAAPDRRRVCGGAQHDAPDAPRFAASRCGPGVLARGRLSA
jgi:dihydroflavonol-4-reductase